MWRIVVDSENDCVTDEYVHCLREHALKTLERLREMEKNEAKIKISALELKVVSLQLDHTINQHI